MAVTKADLDKALSWIKLGASGTICAVPAYFWGYSIKAGSTEATLTINDGGAGGNDFFYAEAAANDFQAGIFPVKPLIGITDLYAVITGTGPTIYIYYDPVRG